MKRLLLLCAVCLPLIGFCQAQQLKMYKTFGGARFEMDTLVLSPKQVLEILKVEPAAYEEFKRAKANYNVAGVMGFSGAFLIAFPVVSAISGGDPEWGFAAGGAALILGSIHFNRVFKGRAFHALELYNTKLTTRIQPTLYFYGTQARLVIRF
ncbi:MAG: hypothetical protein ABL895_00825 [Cyclobacteriaceae bacterium]